MCSSPPPPRLSALLSDWQWAGESRAEGQMIGMRWTWTLFLDRLPVPPHTVPISTKPNPNQIISVGSKPGMNGAGFQKGLTCESCHSEFQGGSGTLGGGRWGLLWPEET